MAKPKNQKPPFALRALAAFAVTLAALFVLLLAAYALPGEPVRDHVYDSAVKIAGEGLYPEYLNFKLFQMDNYTDTIMLTEAASADEAPPLTAMMTNTAKGTGPRAHSAPTRPRLCRSPTRGTGTAT